MTEFCVSISRSSLICSMQTWTVQCDCRFIHDQLVIALLRDSFQPDSYTACMYGVIGNLQLTKWNLFTCAYARFCNMYVKVLSFRVRIICACTWATVKHALISSWHKLTRGQVERLRVPLRPSSVFPTLHALPSGLRFKIVDKRRSLQKSPRNMNKKKVARFQSIIWDQASKCQSEWD